MDCPLISVIVPVYKAEPYLERCVNSIRNQTYINLEIILVDDGSPDRCGEMCDEFALEDSRIRVFHKENGGQSSARNLALDHMTGEYVGFVDSDDWIEPDMYRRLYNQIVETESQISICGLQCDLDNGQVAYFNPFYPKNRNRHVFSTIEALRELTFAQKITNSPCDKLFQSSIFDGIRMSVGRVYEDFEMMPHCLEKAQRISYDPLPLYHYVMTRESTTRGVFTPRRFLEAELSRERVRYYQEMYPDLLNYAMAGHVGICLNLIDTSAVALDCVSKRKSLIHELQTNVSVQVFKLLARKIKIKYLVFRISPLLYTKLIRMYHARN